MNKLEMIEFLTTFRDQSRREANSRLHVGITGYADDWELEAQKFHAIICYLEGRANV